MPTGEGGGATLSAAANGRGPYKLSVDTVPVGGEYRRLGDAICAAETLADSRGVPITVRPSTGMGAGFVLTLQPQPMEDL